MIEVCSNSQRPDASITLLERENVFVYHVESIIFRSEGVLFIHPYLTAHSFKKTCIPEEAVAHQQTESH